MSAVALALSTLAAYAGSPVATARIHAIMTPPALASEAASPDFAASNPEGTLLASCEVTWTLPATAYEKVGESLREKVVPIGVERVSVGPGCPEEQRAAVQEAAAAWMFYGVRPLPDQEVVVVRRWLTLVAGRGGSALWSIEHRDPTLAAPDADCVRPTVRETPDLSQIHWGGGAQECQVLTLISEKGKPQQLEVTGCTPPLIDRVLQSAARWRYKVCEEATPADRLFTWTVRAVDDAR